MQFTVISLLAITFSSAIAAPVSSYKRSSTSQVLFPAGGADGSSSKAWSVSSAIADFLPLSDDTLRPTHLLSQFSHDYLKAPDGKTSMQVVYPEGTAALSGADTPAGGVSFYAQGPKEMDLSNAKEVTFSYSVLFEDGFEFRDGGKLPGVYGGDDAEGSISCSGGRLSDECFSARFMWRTSGKGEAYLYLPSKDRFPANEAQCSQVPDSSCNDKYGNSIGRGLINFTPGTRTTIAQRVRLNDAGQSNGEIEVLQDGKSIFTLHNIVLRQDGKGRIRGIQMQSFFGGHGKQWTSPKDQKSFFGDFSMAITEEF